MAPPPDSDAEDTAKLLERLNERIREIGADAPATAAAMQGIVNALRGLDDALVKPTLEQAIKQFADLNRTLADSSDPLKKFDRALRRSLKTLTGVTDASDTLVGSLAEVAFGSTDLGEAVDTMKTAFSETFSKMNVGVSIARKLGESTFAMAKANEQATAAFNAASGAAGIYDSELVALQMSNIQNGISTTEMAQSYAVLQSSLSGFGVMAESERMRLGELGAQFAKVGVSGADFAGTLQTMTRGFGMSTRAATRMQTEAMELAQTLGKDVGQVLSEMNAALPQLASYGSDAVDMFFDLEKQSQRTGLAVGDLIGIAGNYRTFDSAAEAAGNLNAVLGTQLFSTMGLLEAQLEGPEKVLEYMTENLSNSIGDWDSLSTFHKEAVANAAGMNVEQMNNLMNQKNMTREEKKRAKSLEETMAAGRDLWQELTIFAQNFALAVTPMVDFLVAGFQKVNSVLQKLNDSFISLGEMIAFAFATAGIYKFLKFMHLARTASDLATASTWRQVASRVALQSVGGPASWAMLLGSAAIAGGALMAIKAATADAYAEGTDSTSGRMALVGEEGPELLVPPPNSAVVNNTTMTALAEQGAGGGDGASNTAVVAAVQALGQKLDTMITKLGSSGDFVMQVDRQEFGRVINQHLGEPGSQPLRLKSA